MNALGRITGLLSVALLVPHASSAATDATIRFEENRGQAAAGVRYLSRGSATTLALEPDRVLVRLRDGSTASTVALRIAGARSGVVPAGEEQLPGVSNYLIGSDPARWRTGIPHFARVRYHEVYPGIDLVFHGADRELEFDFLLAPGADPGVIALDVEGGRMTVEGGDLVLSVPGGAGLRLRAPLLYQDADGVHREIAGGYRRAGERRVAFHVGAYDAKTPLVIDPVLSASTYLGGGATEQGRAIALDAAGNIYVTGTTGSTDFPIVNGAQSAKKELSDVFITKLSPAGTTILYSTFVGGEGEDVGEGIAVDAAGNAYVAGTTASKSFPVTGAAFQRSVSGGTINTYDAFVLKLNASGNALVYATYLGGGAADFAHAIAVDAAGNAYVTGSTLSTDFPTKPGAFQATLSPLGGDDVFVAKVNPSGSDLVYSTYLGGSGADRGNAILVDAAGNATVAGDTGPPAVGSPEFPTRSAFQPVRKGGFDAFLARLNAAGSDLVFSSFLGGSGLEVAHGLAADAQGNLYLTGRSESADFPVDVGALDNFNDGADAFVTKVNAQGTAVVYSTLFGGAGTETANGIAVDGTGAATIVGSTNSGSFPVATPLRPYGGSEDAFLVRLGASGKEILFSTPFGGSRRDVATAVAVDAAGTAYVTGGTSSTDFPLASAFDGTYGGPASNPSNDGDAFVLKVLGTATPVTYVVPVVLTAGGAAGSFYTSELALTNRGTTTATLEFSYTAAAGGGTGTGTDTLAPGRQKIVPDAIAYLKSLGVPIPDTGNRVGTLRVRFSGLSSPGAGAVTVRTTTAVVNGRAGLSYAGVLETQTLTGKVTLAGLRQTGEDRSNVAVLNAGGPADGDVVLRLTIRSGAAGSAVTKTLPDVTLGPGGFSQVNEILAQASVTNGYVDVERVGGTAPFYAYGVINDQFNSDGSFVPPFVNAGQSSGLIVPVVVETAAFATEVVITNLDTKAVTLRLAYVADPILTADKEVPTIVTLMAGEQLVVPNFVQYLRSRGLAGALPAGQTYAGALFITNIAGPVKSLVAGARTATPGGGGKFGLFYNAVAFGESPTSFVYLYGLRQDAENRSNLALVNTGENDRDPDVFRVEVFDGDTGLLVKTVDGVALPAKRFTQINTVLEMYAPGTKNAYLRVTRTSGGNPFIVYAVINDGAHPGDRSGDGAFLAAVPGS